MSQVTLEVSKNSFYAMLECLQIKQDLNIEEERTEGRKKLELQSNFIAQGDFPVSVKAGILNPDWLVWDIPMHIITWCTQPN